MQGIQKTNLLKNPSLASLEFIRQDHFSFGHIQEKTKKRIIDEEMTHAAEIVAAVTNSADIPRFYSLTNEDLIDPHGVSLKNVLVNGIDYLESGQVKRPGDWWELRRRKIELKNLDRIIAMPLGFASIEISPTDFSKPEGELKIQGYTGDTLVRVSFKNRDNGVLQRNIIIKSSDLKLLNKLRNIIEKGCEKVYSAEEALEKVQFVSVLDKDFETFIASISNFAKSELLNGRPLEFVSGAFSAYIKKSKNSWDVVRKHQDLFEQMYQRMELLSIKDNLNSKELDNLRAGVWQMLCDEAECLDAKKTKKKLLIDEGIKRACLAGAVFTACGGTIEAGRTSAISMGGSTGGYYDRYNTVKLLIDRLCGIGCCKACGATGFTYGCGVYCKSCNQVWCQAYLKTGKQLSDKEVAVSKYYSFFRGWLIK